MHGSDVFTSPYKYGTVPVKKLTCFFQVPNLHTQALFTRVRTNICTDKNLHSSTLRLHGTGGTGRIFERLSVQVWDLEKAGPKPSSETQGQLVGTGKSLKRAKKNSGEEKSRTRS